jgi:putative addiction module component (TIGR02574 family)
MKAMVRRMSDTAEQLIAQALKLSPLERSYVVEQLLLSLDRLDTEIDAAWASEAESRLAAYDNGTVDAVPASEVFGKYD